MALSPSTSPRKVTQGWSLTGRSTKAILLILAAAVLGGFVFLWIRFWPFEQTAVIQDLQEASDSSVHVRTFHKTYFPYPGCTLQGVVFVHGTVAKPLITIEKVMIRGAYLGVFTHHVSRITAEGLRVFIPPFGSGQSFQTSRSTITIGEIVANEATLEFALRKPDKPPLRFDLHEVSLRDVGWKGPLTYRLKVHNPEPPGMITVEGKFGVWDQNDPAQTPVSGEYKFEQADLSVYEGIAGILRSIGKFGGRLGHIDISGTTDTPDFEVKSGGHPVQLITEFSAYVDGVYGDTFLKRVDAYFRKTHVVAGGSIARSTNDKGKTALIDLSAENGRIEDILGLFVEKKRAPMSGAVTLRAKAEIPSGDRPFLKKLNLRGSFGIGGGEFSHPSTQEGVDKLSAGARGEKDSPDPETVLTDLTGRVALNGGVADFADLSFGVPGATARMQGTYNLINYKIDLRGQMHVDSKIANSSTGGKALLLKMIDPFFKKRKKGEIIPVRISGTFQNPSFGLDLKDKKAQKVALPSHIPPASSPESPR
jgi:AsmA-like C-terminal region